MHRYPTITKEPKQWEMDMWEVQEMNDERRREVCYNFGPSCFE
jgi:hypothetical protein